MKKGLTEIIAIVDKSGSMSKLTNDVIGGFNSFIEEQKKLEGEATLTLVLFDSHNKYKMEFESINIEQCEGLNEKSYVAGGMTALNDAICKTLKSVKKRIKNLPEEKKPERFILFVYTDGEENDSREYTKEKVKEMIKKREDKGWLVVYLGANVDAFAEGAKIGIDKSKSLNWTADADGVKFAYDNLNKVSSAYRSAKSKEASMSVNFENADDKQEKNNNI